MSVELCWPAASLAEVVARLARRLGAEPAADAEAPGAPSGAQDPAWPDGLSTRAGVEAEPFQASHANASEVLRGLGCAVLWLPARERLLAVLAGGRRGLLTLAPDGSERRISLAQAGALLWGSLAAPHAADLERLLDEASIQEPARRDRIGRALLAERLEGVPCLSGFELHLPPWAAPSQQLRRAGLLAQLGILAASHAVRQILLILAFWTVGRGALEGRVEAGWLWAFALLLLTTVPLAALASWAQGVLAVRAGALLKRRLLDGALRLDPDETRSSGAGQLLGRVLESESVESLALSGGFAALLSSIELGLASWVLAHGAAGGALALLLAGWVGLVLAWASRLYGLRRDWTRARVDLSDRLVECMVGQRTRLAQEAHGLWHAEEDRDLEGYYALSDQLDRRLVRLEAFTSRGFLLAALIVFAPALVAAHATSGALAVSVGGILLGLQGLQRLAAGLQDLLGAAIAWEQVAALYRASARPKRLGVPAVALAAYAPLPADELLVEGRRLALRYLRRSRVTLLDESFSVRAGERVLVSGPSGGGKSTLAALLAGLRLPDSGLLLLRGLDLPAWGEAAWRRRVALAPQFHENHLIAAPLIFNLLLGRGWPCSREDVLEAEQLCHELGLGPLLERMPGGLFQPVGETGWQLSHGERGRVFLARALLQRAELTVLDESFGALDADNVSRAALCARNRAATLVVVSHP